MPIYRISKTTASGIADKIREKNTVLNKPILGSDFIDSIDGIPSTMDSHVSIVNAEPTISWNGQLGTGNCTISTQVGNSTEGKQSLKIQSSDAAADKIFGFLARATFSSPLDLSKYDNFMIDIYLPNTFTGGSLGIDFCTSSSYISGGSEDDGYQVNFPLANKEPGWHRFVFKKSSLEYQAPTDWSKITHIKFAWVNYRRHNTGTFLFDNFIGF